MSEHINFRQRLDAVLRTQDIQQVQKFLVEEKQWDVDALPADIEFAMYMMIAGSPTLRDLHERARLWLIAHGHAEDAQAVLGSGQQAAKTGKSKQRFSGNVKGSQEGKRFQEQKKRGPAGSGGGPR